MAKISVNFVKNPIDIYDVAPAIKDNHKLLMQSMDDPALCGLSSQAATPELRCQ